MKNNLAYATLDTASQLRDANAAPITPEPEFLFDLQHGLAHQQKSISPKYFYDAQGSALFDAIDRKSVV